MRINGYDISTTTQLAHYVNSLSNDTEFVALMKHPDFYTFLCKKNLRPFSFLEKCPKNAGKLLQDPNLSKYIVCFDGLEDVVQASPNSICHLLLDPKIPEFIADKGIEGLAKIIQHCPIHADEILKYLELYELIRNNLNLHKLIDIIRAAPQIAEKLLADEAIQDAVIHSTRDMRQLMSAAGDLYKNKVATLFLGQRCFKRLINTYQEMKLFLETAPACAPILLANLCSWSRSKFDTIFNKGSSIIHLLKVVGKEANRMALILLEDERVWDLIRDETTLRELITLAPDTANLLLGDPKIAGLVSHGITVAVICKALPLYKEHHSDNDYLLTCIQNGFDLAAILTVFPEKKSVLLENKILRTYITHVEELIAVTEAAPEYTDSLLTDPNISTMIKLESELVKLITTYPAYAALFIKTDAVRALIRSSSAVNTILDSNPKVAVSLLQDSRLRTILNDSDTLKITIPLLVDKVPEAFTDPKICELLQPNDNLQEALSCGDAAYQDTLLSHEHIRGFIKTIYQLVGVIGALKPNSKMLSTLLEDPRLREFIRTKKLWFAIAREIPQSAYTQALVDEALTVLPSWDVIPMLASDCGANLITALKVTHTEANNLAQKLIYFTENPPIFWLIVIAAAPNSDYTNTLLANPNLHTYIPNKHDFLALMKAVPQRAKELIQRPYMQKFIQPDSIIDIIMAAPETADYLLADKKFRSFILKNETYRLYYTPKNPTYFINIPQGDQLKEIITAAPKWGPELLKDPELVKYVHKTCMVYEEDAPFISIIEACKEYPDVAIDLLTQLGVSHIEEGSTVARILAVSPACLPLLKPILYLCPVSTQQRTSASPDLFKQAVAPSDSQHNNEHTLDEFECFL